MWLITYSTDRDRTRFTRTVCAATYTEAYIIASMYNNYDIIEIKKI